MVSTCSFALLGGYRLGPCLFFLLKERLHTRSYPLQAVRGLDNGSSRALRASCLQHVQNRAVEAGLCSNTTPLRCFRKCHETRRSEVVKVLGGHAGRPGEATQSAERHPPLTCRCREPAKPAQTLVISSPDTGCVSEPAAKRRIQVWSPSLVGSSRTKPIQVDGGPTFLENWPFLLVTDRWIYPIGIKIYPPRTEDYIVCGL
jgi:hypothetical protein